MKRNGPAGNENAAGFGVGGPKGERGAGAALGVSRIKGDVYVGSGAKGCGFFPKSHDRKDINPPDRMPSVGGGDGRVNDSLRP